jgi:hypothetical protein
MFSGRFALARFLAGLAVCSAVAATPVAAADQVYFSSNTNVTDILVNYINHENVRLDISSWYLSEHSISIAIVNRFKAGVPVRLMGDRGAIFEADPNTKREFYWLAAQGVPIRLRFNPTWFPEINHWKMAIFVGQNTVEFGSGNFAPTELAPVSATNYCDDSELFSSDPEILNAFKTKFDVMWNDTANEPQSNFGGAPYFKDWNDACAAEPTGHCSDYASYYASFPGGATPMTVNRARLEPDYPMPADIIWGQGSEMNNRLIQEINAETNRVDFVMYRLEVGNLMQALLDKFNAGVPVRLIIDPGQYTNNAWPEYWLTHAFIDKLFAAGVPVKQRNHQGVTHLKTLITSSYAVNGSSNWGANWQRDHNYFVPRATKPAVWQAFQDNFDSMWNDTTNFGTLVTTGPQAVDTTAVDTVPQPAQNNVAVTTTFTWHRASWAALYDVYLGTSPSTLSLVTTVPAQLVNDPPLTYSWTPASPLNFGTQYYWKVVSRTFANMTASSSIQSFSTPASGSQPPTAPANPSPTSGAAGVGTGPTLTWASAGANNYTIKFGTTNPPPSTGTSTSAPSYSPGTLAANTTYYWQIIANNGAGSTPGPVWTFATSASNLPAPWQSQDVGATGQVGSAIYGSGTYTVRGAGADIWGSADAFQYGYQSLSGDGQIVARITAVQNNHTLAKAGVMIRQSTAANAAHVIMDLRPTGDIEFMSRSTGGGATNWLSGANQALPVWLKLVRSGTTVTGYRSTDGTTWAQVGTTSITFTGPVTIGLVVNSHDTSTLNTSTFDNVTVSVGGSAPGIPGAPSPANAATGVVTSPTLTWTASNATSYDVNFGTTNPPPSVSTGQTSASYPAGSLDAGTTYYWQITARNGVGTTAGPVWSFTTQTTPGAPASPSPANGATGVSTTPALTWSASGATTYDVLLGTSNPPPSVSSGQSGASYTPSALTASTTYFWQVIAHNAAGATEGPVWTFTTQAPAPPATPSSPGPANSATGVSTTPTLTWSASGATSYDVKFGITNPPPTASAGQAAASYTTPALSNSTTYYWQIVASNASGSTAGPIWSFTTTAAPITDNIVIYAADIPSGNFHGSFTTASDGTAAAGIVALTPDAGVAQTAAPLAAPTHYVDVTFDAPGGTPYTFWMRLKAAGNSKFNDSLYVQFSDALASGSPIYPLNTAQGLAVNLATDTTGSSLNNWGWVNGAYWLSQPATLTFASSGPHTLRIQIREDGFQFDQLVFSPAQYFNASASCPTTCGGAPGPVASDSTIVPKPAPPSPPAAPSSPNPANAATGVSVTPALSWTATGATSYDVAFGTTNPPGMVSTGQVTSNYSPASLANSTTYYWRITAHNGAGATVGPVWSFTTTAPPPPPGTPGSPIPAAGATGVSTSVNLFWSASGATSYDVKFGTVSTPPTVSSGQSAANYSPGTLSYSTTYYWQIVARNTSGTSAGPVWSFTTGTAPPPPAAPTNPNPASGATGVSTTPTLTWNAVSSVFGYNVKFGTTNPPPSSGFVTTNAFTPPAALNGGTTYYWQVSSVGESGETAGPVWSFTTAAVVTPTDIVIYASDLTGANLHGSSFSFASDATAAAGTKVATSDTGIANTAGPVASPAQYADITFNANAGVAYTFWIRVKAKANSKFNDSFFVQFSDALAGGSPIYPLNTTQGLAVNLATDTTGSSLNNWGWVNGSYWLSQPATFTFASSGAHTLRIQIREDGFEFDQIVLSPANYFNASSSCPTSCAGAPGGVTNDSTIVPKP